MGVHKLMRRAGVMSAFPDATSTSSSIIYRSFDLFFICLLINLRNGHWGTQGLHAGRIEDRHRTRRPLRPRRSLPLRHHRGPLSIPPSIFHS